MADIAAAQHDASGVALSVLLAPHGGLVCQPLESASSFSSGMAHLLGPVRFEFKSGVALRGRHDVGLVGLTCALHDPCSVHDALYTM